MNIENFKNEVYVTLYFYKFDDYAIIDAYNNLEETEKGWKTSILGLKIWLDFTGKIYNYCLKDFYLIVDNEYYGYVDKLLEQSLKEKGYI